MINLYQVIEMDIRESFDIYFELVKEPRSQAHITYKLSDILFILVIGMLCNCTDLEIRFFEKIHRIRRNTMFKYILKYIKSNKSGPFRIMPIWDI